MLKCVVFPVTAYGYELLSAARGQMETMLEKKGVSLKVMGIESKKDAETFFESEEVTSLESAELNGKWWTYESAELLFVTDSSEILQKLFGEGYYVIAFYHEKNQSVSFKNALYAVEDVTQLTFQSYDEAYRRLAGLPWDILETERLKVRESTVADVEEFYRIYADPSVTDYMEDLFKDPDEERVYMETYIKQFYGFYGFGMWTVLWKETGQVIGRAGLSVREGYDLPELGFLIEVPFQKKGLALEVCSAILKYAKEELLFDKVQALAEEENKASLCLLKKLGFQLKDKVIEKGKEYLFLTVEL